MDLPGTVQVHGIKAARASLHRQDVDLFPEDPLRRVLDEGIVWEDKQRSPWGQVIHDIPDV